MNKTIKDTERKTYSMNIGGVLLNLDKPLIMGIVNLTEDSFYAQSRAKNENEILQKAEKMVEDGATFLDIGAYSTRPGAKDIDLNTELARVTHALRILRKNLPQVYISVDTFRSEVAKCSVGEGAAIINDVSGGRFDNKMFDIVAQLNVPYVLTHSRGNPQNMKAFEQYDDLMVDIVSELQKKICTLQSLGVKDIIVDPGFGFAKNISQNYELLRNLSYISVLEKPIMVGVSRKSMIYKFFHTTPDNALNGTTVLNTVAIFQGAHILRVHDVKEAMEVSQILTMLNKGQDA